MDVRENGSRRWEIAGHTAILRRRRRATLFAGLPVAHAGAAVRCSTAIFIFRIIALQNINLGITAFYLTEPRLKDAEPIPPRMSDAKGAALPRPRPAGNAHQAVIAMTGRDKSQSLIYKSIRSRPSFRDYPFLI
jgi:hypothetical protein